jgi:hypothetical protein
MSKSDSITLQRLFLPTDYVQELTYEESNDYIHNIRTNNNSTNTYFRSTGPTNNAAWTRFENAIKHSKQDTSK